MADYNGEVTRYVIQIGTDGQQLDLNIGRDPSEALKAFRLFERQGREPKLIKETVYANDPKDEKNFRELTREAIQVEDLEATIQGETTQVMRPPAVLDEVDGFGD